MSTDHRPATASWRRPLFPALMSFPAACFLIALLTDIVYARSYNVSWENFSIWLLTIGLLAAALFVIIGLVQALALGLWPSMTLRIGYAAALILSIFNAFVHSRDAYTAVVPTGLTLSILVAAILVVTWGIERFAEGRRGAR